MAPQNSGVDASVNCSSAHVCFCREMNLRGLKPAYLLGFAGTTFAGTTEVVPLTCVITKLPTTLMGHALTSKKNHVYSLFLLVPALTQ
jgi:hypothetical protein